MEPTIYKPGAYKTPGIYKGAGGIYKGRGVYKDGADLKKIEIGGRLYDVVKIGSLLWTVQNLDYVDDNIILGGSPSYDYNNLHAWYYQNNENEFGWNGKKFGLLYNNLSVEYLEQNKDVLLNGFRVPNEADFQNLEDTIGQTNFVNKLKSTQFWNTPGIDEFGFNMVPGGACSGDPNTPNVWDGVYIQSNIRMVTSDHRGKIFRANDNNTYILSRSSNDSFGYSIRLVKDA